MRRNVRIVGGGGGIGLWFVENVFLPADSIDSVTVFDADATALQRLKHDKAHRLETVQAITQSDYEKNADRFVAGDIVVYSVPPHSLDSALSASVGVIKEKSLLITLQSTQSPALDLLKRHSPESCSILGCHPLFGTRQRSPEVFPRLALVALVNYVQADPNHQWFHRLLDAMNINISPMDGQQHDDVMAYVQAATHFVLLALFGAANTDHSDQISKSKPTVFNLTAAAMSRVLDQSSGTTLGIQSTQQASLARTRVLEAASFLNDLFSNATSSEALGRFEEWRRSTNHQHKEISEEGLALSDVFLDGLGRLEALFNSYRASGTPFVCRIKRHKRVIRILKNDYKRLIVEPASLEFDDGAVSAKKHAVALNKQSVEAYRRIGILFPERSDSYEVSKKHVELLSKAELESFYRNEVIPLKLTRRCRFRQPYPDLDDLCRNLLPSLIDGLISCNFEKVDSRPDNLLVKFEMSLDARSNIDVIERFFRTIFAEPTEPDPD